MNNSNLGDDHLANASREEIMSALFASMIIQQSNMALMLLGKMPHPETGQTVHDLEGAKMFIDQLEMIEAKTKGNLTKDEQKLLQQSLTGLRLAFVEAIEAPSKSAAQPQPSASKPAEQQPPMPATGVETSAAGEESRKKFTKKY